MSRGAPSGVEVGRTSIGKDEKAGKTFSATCKKGETLRIKDDRGTPVAEIVK